MGNAAPKAQPLQSYLDSASQYRTYLLEYKSDYSHDHHQQGNNPQNSTGSTMGNQHMVYEQLIGDGRFMKTIQCKYEGSGHAIVKIYRLFDSNEDLSAAKTSIEKIANSVNLERQPNLLPYTDWQYSSRSQVAFLTRQYFLYNLYDRMNTRPFLSTLEKKWLAFQLLKALEQCHELGICHGDIKPENTMVTSWNWIILTDFAPFKPTYLPEDDPSDYYYYFSHANPRSCNIAPERFYSSTSSDATFLSNLADSKISVEEVDRQVDIFASTQNKQGCLQSSMDIFSMGCVIADLFLNEKHVFDLPTLLRYRAGDTTACSEAKKIKDENVRSLVLHMIQRNPHQRSSAKEYREKYTGILFPKYFDNFLFKFMNAMLTPSGNIPDSRIRLICKYYGRIVQELVGINDVEGIKFFKHRLNEGYSTNKSFNIEEVLDQIINEQDEDRGIKKKMEDSKNSFEERITGLHERMSMFMDQLDQSEFNRPSDERQTINFPVESLESDLRKVASMECIAREDNGIILILSLICSSIRHVLLPQTRLTALQLITRLAVFASDVDRLQRLVPYVLEIFSDPIAFVRAGAIRSAVSILSLVTFFSPSDTSAFPKFILPAFNRFPSDPEEIVRITFAECLPKLSEIGRHFLDIAYAMKLQSSDVSISSEKGKKKNKSGSSDNSISSFDKELSRLHKMISRLVIQIAAPDQKTSSSLVKRALLSDISRLCIFFGRERTLDVVLPQLITVLNARDPELRSAFFEHIPGVCAFVGRLALEMYILPCIEQALVDIEEIVIARALQCLATLCSLGLFQRHALVDKVKTTSPLLFHPSWWIRLGVSQLIINVVHQLGPVDVYAFLLPVLRPYLKTATITNSITVSDLQKFLNSPVSREAYDTELISYNSQAETSNKNNKMEESFLAINLDEGNSMLSHTHHDDNNNDHQKLRESNAISLEEEERLANEKQKLYLMRKYVEIASSQMKSNLQLARSEQSAKLRGGNLLKSPSGSNKLHKSLIHIFRIPDIRWAFLHDHPDKENLENLTCDDSSNSNVTMSEIVRQFGLQAIAKIYTPGESIQSLNQEETIVQLERTKSVVSSEYMSTKGSKKNIIISSKKDSRTDPAIFNCHKLALRTLSLGIPPLPPDMGALYMESIGLHYSLFSLPGGVSGGMGDGSFYTTQHTNGNSIIGPSEVMYRNWKPKEGVLIAELGEHSGPVNRIGVAQDGIFFATGSSDGTVKIWSSKEVNHDVNQVSKFTFDNQQGSVTDMLICDNSHSVAAAFSCGSITIFRVDKGYGKIAGATKADFNKKTIKHFNSPNESILVLCHLNTSTVSLIIYATSRGYIHGWDLRLRKEVWKLTASPELGYITCLSHGEECTWLAAGTSRGYIIIWDIRFQLLVKIWRHSSCQRIHRMEICSLSSINRMIQGGSALECLPLVYISAGKEEVALWDLSSGACRSLFRLLQPHVSESDASRCYGLVDVPFSTYKPDLTFQVLGQEAYSKTLRDFQTHQSTDRAIKAILAPERHIRGLNECLLTGGDDKLIRYWDLKNPKRSFTISSLPGLESKAFYDSQRAKKDWWKDFTPAEDHEKMSQIRANYSSPLIYMCQSSGNSLSQSNISERRGPIPPSPAHTDSILDLKILDTGAPMILSGGRDGTVKIWA